MPGRVLLDDLRGRRPDERVLEGLLQPRTWLALSPVAAARPSTVRAGFLSRPGYTPTVYTVEAGESGRPCASSNCPRAGMVSMTARRSPGRSPGTITDGLHTTFQVAPTRRSGKLP